MITPEQAQEHAIQFINSCEAAKMTPQDVGNVIICVIATYMNTLNSMIMAMAEKNEQEQNRIIT